MEAKKFTDIVLADGVRAVDCGEQLWLLRKDDIIHVPEWCITWYWSGGPQITRMHGNGPDSAIDVSKLYSNKQTALQALSQQFHERAKALAREAVELQRQQDGGTRGAAPQFEGSDAEIIRGESVSEESAAEAP